MYPYSHRLWQTYNICKQDEIEMVGENVNENNPTLWQTSNEQASTVINGYNARQQKKIFVIQWAIEKLIAKQDYLLHMHKHKMIYEYRGNEKYNTINV